ncbi:MAG: hypothetical protein U1E76_14675 [Planctomycetota bacterium]
MVRSQLILSTRCLGTESVTVRDLVAAAMLVGANQVGLAMSLDPPDPTDLKAALGARDLRVACVESPWAKGTARRSLGSGSASEQVEALELVKATKRNATHAGAPVLIVDLGEADLADGPQRCKMLIELVASEGLSPAAVAQRDQLVAEREKLETIALDRLSRALFAVLRSEPDLPVAIAPGRPLIGYPTHGMLEQLLGDLRSPRLRYWHDVARAWHWERLGLDRNGAWLGGYGAHLAGVALADVRGMTDGLPPGAGEIDFRALRSALPARCLKLVDVGPIGLPALKMAFDYLRSLGYD